MEFRLSDCRFINYVLLDSPYNITVVTTTKWDNKESKYIEFNNYWLGHKEYGYLMHMFGVYEDFHEFLDDVTPDYLSHYTFQYMQDIQKLERDLERG